MKKRLYELSTDIEEEDSYVCCERLLDIAIPFLIEYRLTDEEKAILVGFDPGDAITINVGDHLVFIKVLQ